MTFMKSILVPFDDDSSQAQLELALQVARIFSSHIDGLSPRTLIEAALYGEGFATTVQEWERREDARVREAAKDFRAFMQGQKVTWEDTAEPKKTATASWIADIDRGTVVVGQTARLYDLTVLARPGEHASSGYYALMETVLFESGRPILIAPPKVGKKLGEVVVIAWNGSTESARTIALAAPFLQRAKQVHVLSVASGMVAGPTADQVRHSLSRSGIAATAHAIGEDKRSPGEAILEETAKLGGDLLIKGAYTHSRLRQMIFGGATSHILREAALPVFMAH